MRPMAVSAARWARASSTERPSSLARAVTLESMRSVRMEPGHTLFTRMPSRPTSSARLLAKATTPMRVAPERARLGMGWYTVLASTLMMRPPPCLFICGTASRHIRAKKTRERCTAVAHCSSVAASARRTAGIVHQNVKASEALHGGGHEVAHRLRLVEIAGESEDLRARRLTNRLCRPLEVGRASAAHGQRCPFFRQHVRAGAAQAFAASADDGSEER